ncbi:MAG: DUF5723 family protein [Chitinophagales bacterium]
MKYFKSYLSVVVLLFLSLSSLSLSAQDFIGFNTTPYAGVNSIDLQPASIAGTVYKFDITAVGASIFAHNNFAQFDPKAFYSWSLDPEKSSIMDGANGLTNIYTNTRVQLPSVMYDIDFNSAVALTIQHRSSFQLKGLSPEVSQLYYSDFQNEDYLGQQYTSGVDMRMLSWMEVGLTYGRVLLIGENQRLKFGARVKYLGGLSSAYLSSDLVTYEVQDSTLNITKGNFEYAHSANLDPYKFNLESSSIGFDLGFKYSYGNRIVFGVSVLDIGKLRFAKTDESGDFALTNSSLELEEANYGNFEAANASNWELGISNYNGLNGFDSMLETEAEFSNTQPDYDVALPTALSLQFTAYLWESGVFEGGGYQNIYINVATYHALNTNPDTKRITAFNTYTITPGVYTLSVAAGMPVTIMNDLESTRIGMFMRLGPFIFGSKNIVSHLFADSVNELDLYAALKVPILKSKPSLVKGCPKFRKKNRY